MPVKPIGVCLADNAAAQPDRPAISCAGRSVTRQELDRHTNRLARAYRDLGVREGDLVAVCLPNGIEFYESCLAAWKLGATPLPISWRMPRAELDPIIALARPRLVVGSAVSGPACVPQGFRPGERLSDGPLEARVAPSLKAITSGGSTGTPKLIVPAQRGEFDTDRRWLGMRRDQVQLVPGPLYHNGPFACSTNGLLAGHHLVVMERFDAEDALRLISGHRVNWVSLVPTMMLRMSRSVEAHPERYDLTSLETVWHGAAPCPEWLKEAWIDLIGPERLFELYGGAEGQAGCHISGTDWLAHRGSVGRPAVGEIVVLDAEGGEAPRGTVGEIYMRRGEGEPPGYHYIGAEARRRPGGWESLGDLGWMDGEGYLYLADRRTDMITSGGANVYAAEVESAILRHPLVLSCVVVGLPDRDLGQRVHAVVQPAAPLSQDRLLGFLDERLVRYKIPRSVRFVDEPLRDDAGKVRRSAIREQEAAIAPPLE
ncbi:AMP-binding protein [Actinomadura sp. 7K507]|uniref:AMP-binding protein n=1 Tax=Actinomadura sp. 7K507 TaxID=2530365 RepID=UPI00104CC751|nr:AMP-binding protein [Actinomadura sp. 7K507]TDC87438.1 acid--CoA ligase [Actinomadura sp. 7K507]